MKITNLNNLPLQKVSHNREIIKRVMLDHRDIPHLTNFSQATFAPGQIASAHFHVDMCEVFFVSAGTGIMRIEKQEYNLTPGICIAVESGETHEVVNTGTDNLVLIYFGVVD